MLMDHQQQPHNKVEPCDICNSSADQFNIDTCIRCRINCAHRYCRRKVSASNDWVCEDCVRQEDNDNESMKKVADDPIRQSASKKSKDLGKGRLRFLSPESAKVKFIPPEEAIKLSSGVVKGSSNNQRQTPSSSKSFAWKNLARNKSSSHVRIQVKPSISKEGPQSSRQLEEPTAPHTRMPENTGADSLLSVPKPPDEIGTSRTSMNTVGGAITAPVRSEEQPMDACKPSQSFLFSNSRVKRVRDRISSRTREEADIPQTANKEVTNATIGSEGRFGFDDIVDRYYRNLPVRKASWTGAICIDDSSIPSRYYELEAFTPSRVKRSLLEFLTDMPRILFTQFQPQNQYWEELFLDHGPDLDDVGLYFYPKGTGSSKESFSSLDKFMETRNLMIRAEISDVELRIYTSKQLPLESQNLMAQLERGSFLWGFFQHTKETFNGEHTVDDCAVIDMEVDMEGGKDIGIIDVVVPKQTSRRMDDIPPGFEFMLRHKVSECRR